MSIQHQPSPIIPLTYSGYRTCDACGHQFYQEQAGQTTCNLCATAGSFWTSERHRQAYAEKKQASPPPPVVTLECDYCKQQYQPHQHASRRRFCSDTCRYAHNDATKKARRKAAKV